MCGFLKEFIKYVQTENLNGYLWREKRVSFVLHANAYFGIDFCLAFTISPSSRLCGRPFNPTSFDFISAGHGKDRTSWCGKTGGT